MNPKCKLGERVKVFSEGNFIRECGFLADSFVGQGCTDLIDENRMSTNPEETSDTDNDQPYRAEIL